MCSSLNKEGRKWRRGDEDSSFKERCNSEGGWEKQEARKH